MDSSFLMWVNVGLAIYSTICFFKLLIQFGLSNHPARFTAQLVMLCVCGYFVGQALVDFNVASTEHWSRWRVIPIVAGSLAMLLQVTLMGPHFSRIQQKVISRLPLIASILCFAFFSSYANIFFAVTIIASALFLTISVGKNRYQKRQYLKMAFFLMLFQIFQVVDIYWVNLFGELFLFAALFYFFIFEHTFTISAQLEDLKSSLEGES
jgi:hypothetical protein